MSLRFPIALVLSIVCLVAPAWADFKAGEDAYDHGDYATAMGEMRPLAEQGDAGAQFNLGLLYIKGDGVSQDYTKARQWYEKAAAQGDAEAQFVLGTLFALEQGVPRDYVRAYMWITLAAAGNLPSDEQKLAVDSRDKLASIMTPAQIAEAQKLAREWTPKDK